MDHLIGYIGKAIAYYREKKEWTTVQLANESGLSQGSISHYENGNRNPSETALGKIANALGITITDITEYAERTASNDNVHANESSPKYAVQDSEYERIRQTERIYKFNDFVFQLNTDVLLSINTRVFDLATMTEYSNRPGGFTSRTYRRDRTSLIAHLTEKVFNDFITDHRDELSVRLEDELNRLQMDGYQLIEELRHNNK
jgi:transcriptional regulator with XRE-family HTH domain